jgi:hypothetical protein
MGTTKRGGHRRLGGEDVDMRAIKTTKRGGQWRIVGEDVDVSQNPVMARLGLTIWNAATSRWRWELFNWYCTLAQTEPEMLSEGDWLNLQEEIMTLRILINYENAPKPVSQAEVRAFQKEIYRRLKGLADPPHLVAIKQPGVTRIFQARWDAPISALDHPAGLKGLLYHLGDLMERTLEINRTAVQRCRRCQRIFIQLRRHAEFCSRQCQSREAVKGK